MTLKVKPKPFTTTLGLPKHLGHGLRSPSVRLASCPRAAKVVLLPLTEAIRLLKHHRSRIRSSSNRRPSRVSSITITNRRYLDKIKSETVFRILPGPDWILNRPDPMILERISKNAQGDCCICLVSNIHQKSLVYCATGCGAVFHKTCLQQYGKPKCPCCRQVCDYTALDSSKLGSKNPGMT